jgi:hypothetical protein
VNRVNEEWFSDVDAVRRGVGLLEEPAPETPKATRQVGARLVAAWGGAGRIVGCQHGHVGCSRVLLHLNKPPPVSPARQCSRNRLHQTSSQCLICFDDYPKASMHAGPCRHYFCGGCWRGYTHEGVCSGPACLDLRCPLPECKIAVSAFGLGVFWPVRAGGQACDVGLPLSGVLCQQLS